MSHAANLRKYRPQPTQQLPQKRRKLSPSATAEKLTNGVLVSDKSLSAVPTHDLKAEKQRSGLNGSNVAVAHPHDTSTNLDHESSSSSSSDDNEESNSQDSSDDDDSDDASKSKSKHTTKSDEASDGSDVESDAAHGDAKDTVKPNIAFNSPHTPIASGPDSDEPTFGDLLASRAPETIVVEQLGSNSANVARSSINASDNKGLSVPSANSLGTVLTQALKTNDVDLLESCLHVPNLESIRATIERIHPAHATTLLKRLAERLHKRPGRAGSLMVWVQWTVVAHGGYLASQPAAMRELRTLYQVVKQRASGLQPLLALKGKLDMLEAQMQLRRNIQSRSKVNNPEDAEENILYVEGQEQSESEDGGQFDQPSLRVNGRPSKPSKSDDGPPADLGSEDMLIQAKLPNGVSGSADEADGDFSDDDDVKEDESGSSSEEQDALIDDEAEEEDSGGSEISDDIDYDDVDGEEDIASEDDDDEDEDDEETIRATKRQRHDSKHGSKYRG